MLAPGPHAAGTRCWCSDERGRSNQAPPGWWWRCNPNLPPQIALGFPGKDVRVSPLEELALEAKIRDDAGVMAHGISYRLAGQPERELRLGAARPAQGPARRWWRGRRSPWRIWGRKPDQLLTYHFWAEDRDGAGKLRRAASDMYFAEVRPFEERFREAPGGEGEEASSRATGRPDGRAWSGGRRTS